MSTRLSSQTFVLLCVSCCVVLFAVFLARASEAAETVTSDVQDQTMPSASFGQDVFLVVWEHEYSAADHDVYFRLTNSVGVPTGTSIAVAASVRWEGAPSVAHCDDTGNFLVVWEEVAPAGDRDIRGQLYGSDGSAVGEVLEIASGASEQLHPTVAWGDSRWLVVWHEQIAANPLDNDLHAILLQNDGTPDGSEIVLASEDTDESAPAAVWGDDRFLVAWQDAASGEYDIVSRTVTTGGALGSATTLADWEYDQIRPAVAFSPENESYLVVWEDHHWGFGEDWDIYGRRVSTTGAALGGLVSISWDGSTPRTAPAIAYDSGNAEYQVAWVWEPSAGNRDLWHRRVSAGAALIGAESSLSALNTDEMEPAVAGDGQYGWLVAWEDGRDSESTGIDVWAEFVEQFRLSGRVYAGSLGDTSSPLEGVTVELYCSQNQGEREALVVSAVTDANGWWGLKPTAACEYHELWMVDPQYYLADDASSVDGDVLAATWIEYPIPLRDKVLTGNLFFTVPQDPAPEPWRDFDPQSWWNSSLTVPVSVEISDIGSGLDVASALFRVSRDGGSVWGDWSPASCSGNNGSNGPETVSTSIVFEGDSGTLYWVQFSIADMAMQQSESPVYPVKVDTTPPQNPAAVNANLSTSTWYGDADITLSWQPGTDATSGVAGYSLLWDTSASTVPDDSIEDQDNHIEDLIPGQGQSWSFHLRTVDQAGNAAVGGVHTGPYWLDTTPPVNPASATCTPPASTWSSASTVSCNWTAGADVHSGLAGYSYEWSTSFSTLPDISVDTTGTSAASPILASNTWYLQLRSVDSAGNGAASAKAIGPFGLDRDPPSSSVNPLSTHQSATTFTVSWGGTDGAGSGIVSYDVRVEDITAGTTTTWKSATTLVSDTFSGVRNHTYRFSSRARDLVGNLESYPAAGGDALTTVGTSIPIRVRNQSGAAVSGARVYHNGASVGVTDGTGLRYVPGALINDTVSALSKILDGAAQKSDHGGWSWRVYLTSVGIDNDGDTSLHSISSTAEQVLTVRKNQPLIGLHMVVSVEFDATTAYLNDLRTGLENASEYLYDATDGQLFWESIELKDNAVSWADADIKLYASNQVWPVADVGGIREGRNKVIDLGRLFNGDSSNRGQWSKPKAFRTIIHEIGHYIGLWDEYLDRNGKEATTAFCTTNYNRNTTDDGEQASIMYRQYESTEFCSRADGTHTHRSQTQHDFKTGGESTWETIERIYKDQAKPERWTLRSPDDRGTVVEGPTAIPVSGWSTTVVTNANTSSCAPVTHIVRYSNGALAGGVNVWIDRPSPQSDIIQGLTNNKGEIDIYGAHNGDTVRAQVTGASASSTISCTAATKDSGPWPAEKAAPEVVLEDDGFTVATAVAPLGGSTVRLSVAASVELAAAPVVELYQAGVGDGITVTMARDPGQDAWSGDLDLNSDFLLSGQVVVSASDLSANTVHRLTPFSLSEAGPADSPRIHSPDGVFELLLAEGSLSGDAVIGTTTSAPGVSDPEGLQLAGEIFTLKTSSGESTLLTPAVVNIRYQGDQVDGLDPSTLQLHRLDGASGSWVPIDGNSNPDFNIVSSEVDRLSVFALFGGSSNIFSDGFESGDSSAWSSTTP